MMPAYFCSLFACGKCGTRQLIYTGDPDDLTLPDVDAWKCYQCGHVEILFDDWQLCHDNPLTETGQPLEGNS